jgi:hypothetical protein
VGFIQVPMAAPAQQVYSMIQVCVRRTTAHACMWCDVAP